MKKIILTILSLYMFNIIIAQNAKPTKPSLMVIPSLAWCKEKGYIKKINNQGEELIVADYGAALTDKNMKLVITSIGSVFKRERGFELELLDAALQSIAADRAEEAGTSSKSNASISNSPLDEILKKVTVDIVLDIDYTVNSAGGVKNKISFNLTAYDSYTNKQVGSATGVGPESFETVHDVLLLEAVNSYITNLANDIQTHFDEQLLNGREIKINISIFENAKSDLETEINGKSYQILIEDWLRINTVNKGYKIASATDKKMYIKEIRIPMFDENNNPIDADRFAYKLQKYLENEGKIKIKKLKIGIGKVNLILFNE